MKVDEVAELTIAPEAPLNKLTEALIRNAVHQEILANRDASLRSFCLRDDTPEDVLFELYERGLCLTELGHRKGPRRLLERIARETRYPEAVITLAIELYTTSAESVADFQAFVQEHSDNYWMLESLAHQAPSSEQKANVFRQIAPQHPDAERLLKLVQVLNWQQQAKSETRASELNRLFETREPKVWRSLGSNPLAPREILEQLAEAQGMPLAREIRNSARTMLLSRESLPNRHGQD